MKAQITTKHHENTGGTFRVIEILQNRIFCLDVDGRKVDFGRSEVRLMPSHDVGRDVLWEFTKYGEESLTQKNVSEISKRAAAALCQRKSDIEKSCHLYINL